MSRYLGVMVALLAVAGFAEAGPRCQSDARAQSSAACRQAGRLAPAHRWARPVAAWGQDDGSEDEAWTVLTQNAFLNQCLILDYRLRATERAMYETEYWSQADRYREIVQALRAEQYGLGCFG